MVAAIDFPKCLSDEDANSARSANSLNIEEFGSIDEDQPESSVPLYARVIVAVILGFCLTFVITMINGKTSSNSASGKKFNSFPIFQCVNELSRLSIMSSYCYGRSTSPRNSVAKLNIPLENWFYLQI